MHHFSSSCLATLLAVPALASCGTSDPAVLDPQLPPVDEASLRVEVAALVEVVRPRDLVFARITNLSTEVVYENLCDGGIEGLRNGGWDGSYGVARACPNTPGQD